MGLDKEIQTLVMRGVRGSQAQVTNQDKGY